ncbi:MULTISPECIES: hypothetical protein [unclassified Streptomyces]|uniref:hypothetical protein n=1 Tax=unclassified Streptomyces TaxID=2593676 RepID=UPI001BE84A07|nr:MULTISPECIES: hypothetical protein [unclassified Streptomyces]MBT2405759.1 hypothetical protein [Streptomyces sp. ISL-21]MBT2458897.1 hypothetical protein [Streptomyces sp. ISL-86]MBT2610345.1 hypothetical protein [Streptomyces sp. ISL-87]
MTNENILTTDGDIKPLDNHASGIEIKPLDNHASGGTPLTTQETPAADEEIQTLDNHASGTLP